MPLLLICTVGGAPEPVVASILCPVPERPQRVVFVCSRDTRAMIQGSPQIVRRERSCPICQQTTHDCQDTSGMLVRLEREGVPLDPGRFDVIELTDPQDLSLCVEELNRNLGPRVREWAARGPEYAVVADFTGGTKCMSVALGLLSRGWPVSFRYVGGTHRTKGGVGVVVSGREQIVHSKNPWDVLGYQAAEQALTLFNLHDYGAASRLLEPAVKGAEEVHIKRSLATLRSLCDAFSLWDRFQHNAALAKIRDVRKNQNDLGRFLSQESAQRLERLLPVYEERLQSLQQHRPSLELIEDLLANAQRRLEETRFDDAVARAYRAIEAIAQRQLAERHGIDSARVPLEKIPEAWRPKRSADTQEGCLKLGLQEDYRLLEALSDPLGQKFRQMGLYSGEDHISDLDARNQSICAHGFEPVSEKTARNLLHIAMELATVTQEQLLQFPRL